MWYGRGMKAFIMIIWQAPFLIQEKYIHATAVLNDSSSSF